MALTPSQSHISMTIFDGLRVLREALLPFVQRTLSPGQRDAQLDFFAKDLSPGTPQEQFNSFDAHKLLSTIRHYWHTVFRAQLSNLDSQDVEMLYQGRHANAHQQFVTREEAIDWFDIAARLLRQIGAAEDAAKLEKIRATLTEVVVRPTIFRAPYTLSDGLEGLPGDQTNNVSRFLEHYLGTADKPAIFGGRAEQLHLLDDWFASPESACALITGLAGRGKSALLTQWAQRLDRDGNNARIVFVPVSLRFSTADRAAALGIFGARLRALYGDRRDLPLDAGLWNEEIRHYLSEDQPADGLPLLVIIDGADETIGWELGHELYLPSRPGRGVKIMVSARLRADRDAAGWLRQLGWEEQARHIEVPPLAETGVREIVQAERHRLPPIEDEERFVTGLMRLSEGDPLLVWLYMQALQQEGEQPAFLREEDLSSIDPGLKVFFDTWLEHQERQWGDQAPLLIRQVAAVLDLLACAKGSLAIEDLVQLGQEDELRSQSIYAALKPLRRFIVGDAGGEGYTFAHPRLRQYFADKLKSVDLRRYAQRFVLYGDQLIQQLESHELQPRDMSSYVLRHHCLHLAESRVQPEQLDRLLHKAWLDAHEVQEGGFEGYLADLEVAWKLVRDIGRSPERGAWAIGWQCRCLLICASIQSLTTDFPTELLVALTEEDIWSPYQALGYARRLRSPAARTETLIRLLPSLPHLLQLEAITYIQAIPDPALRCEGLACAATHLDAAERAALVEHAYDAYGLLSDADDLVGCAAALEPLLKEAQKRAVSDAAWAAARTNPDVLKQLQILEPILPFISKQQKRHLLEAIERLQPATPSRRRGNLSTPATHTAPHPQAQALAVLAPHLANTALWKEAVALARGTSDARARAALLKVLIICDAIYGSANTLTFLEEAIKIVGPSPDLLNRLARARKREEGDSRDAPQQQEPIDELRTEVLQVLDAWCTDREDGFTVINGDQYIVDNLRHELATLPDDEYAGRFELALQSIKQIDEAYSAFEIIEAVITVAKEVNQPSWALRCLRHLPLRYQHDEPRSYALRKHLAWLAQSDCTDEVHELVTTLAAPDQVEPLTLLAKALPPSQRAAILREALMAARRIQDYPERIDLLLVLLARLPHAARPPLARQLRDDIQHLDRVDDQHESVRVNRLLDLVPYFGPELIDDVLAEIRLLAGSWGPDGTPSQVPALQRLSGVLSWDHIANELVSNRGRSWSEASLPIFAARLVELTDAPAIVGLVQRMGGSFERTLLLLDLITRVDPASRALLLHEPLDFYGLVEWAQTEGDASILSRAFPFLPLPLMDQVVAAIEHWSEQGSWSAAELALTIIRYLPEDRQAYLLPILLQWVAATRDEGIRMWLLPMVTRHIPYQLREQVIALVEMLDDAELCDEVHAWAYTETFDEGYEDPRVVEDNDTPAAKRILRSMEQALSEIPLDDALLQVSEIEDEASRTEALIALAPQLSSLDHFALANDIIATLTDEGRCLRALVAFAPHIPDNLVPQALVRAQGLQDPAERSTCLLAFVGRQSGGHRDALLAQVVETTLAAWEQSERPTTSGQLVSWLVQLHPEQAYEHWCALAWPIAEVGRAEAQGALTTLVPLIGALGGPYALQAAAESALELRDWFR